MRFSALVLGRADENRDRGVFRISTRPYFLRGIDFYILYADIIKVKLCHDLESINNYCVVTDSCVYKLLS